MLAQRRLGDQSGLQQKTHYIYNCIFIEFLQRRMEVREEFLRSCDIVVHQRSRVDRGLRHRLRARLGKV